MSVLYEVGVGVKIKTINYIRTPSVSLLSA